MDREQRVTDSSLCFQEWLGGGCESAGRTPLSDWSTFPGDSDRRCRQAHQIRVPLEPPPHTLAATHPPRTRKVGARIHITCLFDFCLLGQNMSKEKCTQAEPAAEITCMSYKPSAVGIPCTLCKQRDSYILLIIAGQSWRNGHSTGVTL